MCPILSLQVHLRILHHIPSSFQHQTTSQSVPQTKTTHPILVVKHDCRGEVDAQPTRARAQKEEPWSVWLVAAMLESFHLRAAFQWARRTVYATQWPVFEFARPILSSPSSMNK